MKKNYLLQTLLYILLLSFFSCKNDELDDYIQRSANKQELIGTWAIYNIEINGNKSEVPVNILECGRDYFSFNANDTYEETIFTSSNCDAEKNILNWQLSDGIINLYSNNGESENLEIRKLNKDILIFQANLDLDENDGKEAYIFTALKFTPPKEKDIYTNTFYQKSSEKVEFTWDRYKGYNDFVKYEIYRTDDECNLLSTKLIKTITNINENFFVDLEAFSAEHCYMLKVYTDDGLLGESDLRKISTHSLLPNSVKFQDASVNGETVSLSWEKSTDPYFSHYEINVFDTIDYSPNQSQDVVIIDDINTTTYTDTNPPYLYKPVYTITVHNKFGNFSHKNYDQSSISVNLDRVGMLDIYYLQRMAFDKDDHSFIFYYRESTYGSFKIAKYNYLAKKIVAESYKQPTISTSASMKIVNSENTYGQEFIYPQGDELWFYNADDLTYKYSIQLSNQSTGSFSYLGNNIWVVTDSDDVFTYKRDNENFTLLDKKPHFSDHQGGGDYQILKLDSNNILVSHDNEGRAIYYKINESGAIENNGIKNIPLIYSSDNSAVSLNTESEYILSRGQNRIYSLNDFSLIKNYTNPAITSNLSLDGKKVYGTNNSQDLTNNYDTAKKEIKILNIETGTTETLTTKGYPLFIAEDKSGNIICLSANFPGETFRNFSSREKNLFVEIVEK